APQGVAGELCVGGAGLARGYLNRPELTAQRFIDHPYHKGEKLYRSGDLARMLPDGDFEYLGRIDHQVKIRGFRIELGEIESKLLLHMAVKDVLVVDREDVSGDKYLCAYVVADDSLTAALLRQHLAALLPGYMVPAFFVLMESFPLTANGKIDRRKLPQPGASELSEALFEEPQTATEKLLAELWKQVLNVPRVGRNDNFFELGGHSLKAARLVTLIHKRFHVGISLKQIFTRPDLSGLAESIRVSSPTAYHTIERAPLKEAYPASSAEKRLFILDQIDGPGISYNVPIVYAIEGDLDLKRLVRAIRSIVDRHEILRTSFAAGNGEIVQRIQDKPDLDIEIHNCEEDNILDFIRQSVRPFDLSQGPLLRAGLIRTRSGQYFLMIDMHHIISDGVSIDNMFRELAALYQGEVLPELKIQSKDYAVWQQQWLRSAEASMQKAFWKDQFAEETQLLNMPVDFVRPATKSYEGDLFKFAIPQRLTHTIRDISKRSGATPFMVILAAYNILLAKYSGQEDIVIGTAVAGRSHADVQELIGMFVNTLPLRNFPGPEKQFLDFVTEVRDGSLKAIENQDYPFETLLDDLEVKRDMSRNPLFDVMLSFRAGHQEEIPFADLLLRAVPFRNDISKMDLSLEVTSEDGGDWHACIEYATKLFSRETIKRLAGHFNHILEQIAADPLIQLKNIALITEKEKEQILHFNHPEIPGACPAMESACNVYDLFAEKAARYPDHIAVETEKEAITYKVLNEKVSYLAALLIQQGCGADKIIGLHIDRSINMIIGVLATLKAGGAYLPIDAEYPQGRIHYMLQDSNALLVLTQRKLEHNLAVAPNKIFLDEIIWPEGETDTSAPANSTAGNLAYVIYTSGSTGQPKGVQIEHRSLYNFLLSNACNYPTGFGVADVCLSISTISFDVSVLEIFMPLVNGAKLVIVTREHAYDVQALANVLVHKKITFGYLPLSLLQPLYQVLKDRAPITLNKLDVGAESIKDTILENFNTLNKDMRILNGYGPTETTIACSWYAYQPGNAKGQNVLIGKPMHNTRIYIVNEQMQLQPLGVPGELCIAGSGLARGYLNNPGLTAEKFVDNPFEPEGKLYKTGDLTKWQADGNIDFIGRKDQQVKIRGYRIELGEIENKLMVHPEIKQALVIDKTDHKGNKYLCAYLVGNKEVNHAVLRTHLASELPVYMIPSFFIVLGQFPLTKNEKIDRKALPEPDTEKKQLRQALVLPANATEASLLHIWETVLDSAGISVTDNFFELGGNSLKIIHMLGLIQQSFDDALKVSDLFDKPTIREQATTISSGAKPAAAQNRKAKRVEF
uniref:non-ribosomal peptide synthetase n=1 Tax=Taibaiella koreensis TaxID=1268548 RepID=UPI000E599383